MTNTDNRMMSVLWAIANSGWGIAAGASMLLNLALLFGWVKEFCGKEQQNYEQQKTIEKLENVNKVGERLIAAQEAQLQILRVMLIQNDPKMATRVGLITRGIAEGWIYSTVVPFARKS